MEAKNKSSEIGCAKEKRTSQIGLTVGGAGGIGGLVVVGGALAVAGLMAAFTVFKSRSIRKEDVDEDEDTVEKFTITNEKNDANSEGLRSVIQTPPIIVHQNSWLDFDFYLGFYYVKQYEIQGNISRFKSSVNDQRLDFIFF